MEIYDYTPCKICNAEVPMGKKICIACKAVFLDIIVEYYDETEEDLTKFADFLMNEGFVKEKPRINTYQKKYARYF